ncbi:MAG: response regulator [Anaerolineales bacterium]
MARILIVDDSRSMAEILSQAVEFHGHEALVASSGQQALDLISRDGIDLVLLDLMMPEMDGFETLRRLRMMPRASKLPVIVVSAREEADLPQRVSLAGGDAFLRKPVEGKNLVAVISRQLKRS